VSSQAWKKAIRDDFRKTFGDEYAGCRTKKAVELIARKIMEIRPDDNLQNAQKLAREVLDKAKEKNVKKQKRRHSKDTATSCERQRRAM
jgi:CRISPR system Cascade subunit CasC